MMENLLISQKLLKCEQDIYKVFESLVTHEIILTKEGFAINDNEKLKQASAISTISRTQYFFFGASGSFAQTFFLRSVIETQAINNEIIEGSVNKTLVIKKIELMYQLESILDNIDDLLNNNLLNEESLSKIKDYEKELKNYK